ncbi:MAG: hypothetical protein HRU11_12560 [Parvularculaceae bacterium]|nr:hypothetical protein [Parvularculaceae bacterium]
MTNTVEMKFTNSDARPKVETVTVASKDADKVARWYGGFFAGDRYSIHINGEKVEKSPDGEIEAR